MLEDDPGSLPMVPDGFRVDRVFMNLQGRHTADVRYHPEEPGHSGGALGYSWSSYQAAADDAVAYLQDVEQDHRPATSRSASTISNGGVDA